MSSRAAEHTELPIPNGWFAVAWSRDLVPGDVQRLRYFDEELALFRTRSGEPKVLDAYCAHLGAHLGEGGRVGSARAEFLRDHTRPFRNSPDLDLCLNAKGVFHGTR